MREIKQHETNDCNRAIRITADERNPKHGNASHNYHLCWFIEREGKAFEVDMLLQFQNGPIQEVGINGVTNEALLAILIDRLDGFQEGPYACSENADALKFCQTALAYLNVRTEKRIARGVEGTHEV